MTYMTQIEITDDAGHGPFKLVVNVRIAPARAKTTHQPPKEKTQTQDSPSRPDVIEVHYGPEVQPLTIQKVPDSHRLQIAINKDSKLLDQAKLMKSKEEMPAVEFVFKYGWRWSRWACWNRRSRRNSGRPTKRRAGRTSRTTAPAWRGLSCRSV